LISNYRPDIDGLRAVAVLSVLFFHSGFTLFSGGYVGVDVFFVISGYLITNIVVREIDDCTFSIVNFYERRFRRLMPALMVVIFVSLAFGALLLTPTRLVDLGQSAVASTLFSSNILFYLESGYFGGAAETKPLLHTWSLAVEEQYYIFFPLLLIFIAKTGAKHYFKWLSSLSILSFIACVILTRENASAAFYWIPTRAWELFIGSMLALNSIAFPIRRIVREVSSLTGISMILTSVFMYSAETPFPGYAALLPTIGTALVIYSGAGGSSFVNRILSLKPLVFIGFISYSLYLWHWPIIVYTKLWFIKELTFNTVVVMLTFTAVVSILSWRYIESPFRRRALLNSKKSIYFGVFATSAVTITIGLIFILNDGFSERKFNNTSLISKKNDYKWLHWESCEDVTGRISNKRGLCEIGSNSGNAHFLLWGDSHARSIASGVHLSARSANLKGRIAAQTACPPLLTIERPNRDSCNNFNLKVMTLISETPDIKTVILAARWPLSVKGDRYKEEHGSYVKLIDTISPSNSMSNTELFKIGLGKTIEKLNRLGKRVVLINSVPEVGYDVPSALVVASINDRNVNSIIAPTKEEFKKRNYEVHSIFNELNKLAYVDVISIDEYLCDAGHCKVMIDGRPLYRDDDHLSTYGSEHLSPVFDKIFSDL
jgi:peptidoglycan/LPS O-acetylase OafA/YrhL